MPTVLLVCELSLFQHFRLARFPVNPGISAPYSLAYDFPKQRHLLKNCRLYYLQYRLSRVCRNRKTSS